MHFDESQMCILLHCDWSIYHYRMVNYNIINNQYKRTRFCLSRKEPVHTKCCSINLSQSNYSSFVTFATAQFSLVDVNSTQSHNMNVDQSGACSSCSYGYPESAGCDWLRFTLVIVIEQLTPKDNILYML